MKNRIFHAALLAASLGIAAAAHAQAAASSAADTTAFTEGEIRRIDRAQQKLTIRHGEIRNLDMAAMTMVFAVPDAALLDSLQPGDRILFRADRQDGKLRVTQIRRAP